jgi:DNA-binding MarR family transcriptional regulator
MNSSDARGQFLIRGLPDGDITVRAHSSKFEQNLLTLTDGNLGSHLQTLEEAGYVKIKKGFVNRKPRTSISLTRKGRYEFEEHVAALKQILS